MQVVMSDLNKFAKLEKERDPCWINQNNNNKKQLKCKFLNKSFTCI